MSKSNLKFRKTLVARALTMAFGVGIMTVGVTPAVMAQSNTTGSISGKVDASKGGSVAIAGIDNGTKHTIKTEANGEFRFTQLPIGNYKVSQMRDGTVVNTTEVEVRIGRDSVASLEIQTVQVSSRRKAIDMSNSTGGSSFTAKELASLPIAPAITNIVQLAGGTTRGDSRYGNNAASFGGSGASENAAYLNGFPITNALFQVGWSSLPFGSIGEASIITGGYGAEFGRSTGGVINITTRSGTNQWEFGAGFTFAPNAGRGKAKNVYYPNTGAPENIGTPTKPGTDGTLLVYNEDNKFNERIYNVSVAGPIIKDKLFMYLAAESNQTDTEATRLSSASSAAGSQGWLQRTTKLPRGLAKIDWNITEDQHLEYTGVRDVAKVKDQFYGFDYTTRQRNQTQKGGASYKNFNSGGTLGALAAPQGTNLDILKYSINVTDNLSAYAMVGRSRTEREQIPVGYISGLAPIVAAPANRVDGVSYTPTTIQGFTGGILRDDAHDQNIASRADVEWRVTKEHTLRAGVDKNKITAINGSQAAGGGTWTYLRTSTPNTPVVGTDISTAASGGYGTQGYYVDFATNRSGSTPSVDLSAAYIEDRYQVTKDILVTAGLRSESFQNFNGKGEVFVEQKNQIAPRLNLTWNVFGDDSLKFLATAGRYHLQLPANLAVRFAGASLNTDQFYTYTGVDPATGAPLGLKPISGITSANKEFGQEKDAKILATTGLKAHYQDEINLGFEKALSPNYNGSVKFTYRVLKNTIDDYSDGRAISKKLTADESDYFNNVSNWPGALFNPGKDNTFSVVVDASGRHKLVHLTAAEIGFPEDLKRDYKALEFALEHPFRDNWYGKFNYTWSRSYGNQEGQTKSDNAQADVGFTSTWDYPEVMYGATGYLPNDRTHQFKAYGYYAITPELSIGGNMLVASGRPKTQTCNIISDPDNIGFNQYGSIFYNTCPSNNGRGALGRTPVSTLLDMNVVYKPSVLPGVALKVDVLNVTNNQLVNSIDEAQNVRLGGTRISPTSQGVNSYSAPRTVRMSIQYAQKF